MNTPGEDISSYVLRFFDIKQEGVQTHVSILPADEPNHTRTLEKFLYNVRRHRTHWDLIHRVQPTITSILRGKKLETPNIIGQSGKIYANIDGEKRGCREVILGKRTSETPLSHPTKLAAASQMTSEILFTQDIGPCMIMIGLDGGKGFLSHALPAYLDSDALSIRNNEYLNWVESVLGENGFLDPDEGKKTIYLAGGSAVHKGPLRTMSSSGRWSYSKYGRTLEVYRAIEEKYPHLQFRIVHGPKQPRWKKTTGVVVDPKKREILVSSCPGGHLMPEGQESCSVTEMLGLIR